MRFEDDVIHSVFLLVSRNISIQLLLFSFISSFVICLLLHLFGGIYRTRQEPSSD